MTEYANKTRQQNESRTLSANPRSSHQASLGEVLQTVKGSHAFSFIQRTPVQRDPEHITDKDQAIEKFATFVSVDDFEGINTVSREKQNVFSIRETGPDSIKRLEEGKANPKPHTVGAKSVKLKSFTDSAQIKEMRTTKKVQGIPLRDIEGYVGYWGKGNIKGRLAGLTTTLDTKADLNAGIRTMADDELKILEGMKTDVLGLKADPNLLSSAFKAEEEETKCHLVLDKVPDAKKYLPHTWEKLLYTGDYDINEMYDKDGNLMLDPREQAEFLTALNKRINSDAEPITVGEKGLLNPVDSRCRFQHADQATYTDNFKRECDAGIHKADEIVKSLEDTEEGAIAWFNKGINWWISSGFADHVTVRNTLNVRAPDRGHWKKA